MNAWSRVSILDLNFKRPDGTNVTAPCLIVDGHVSSLVTQWFIFCALDRGGVGRGATLERNAQAMKRFAQYHLCHGEQSVGTDLIRGFSRALDAGDSKLGWKPLRYKSGNDYFKAVCQFCDWLVTQPGFAMHSHPNPTELQQMTPFDRAASSGRRKDCDMLYHLYSATQEGRGVKAIRAVRHETRFNKPHQLYGHPLEGQKNQPVKKRPKGMPIDDYFRLLTFEREPRNLLLWLTLGAGACRVSESLQIFASDISWDDKNSAALVALANPIKGLVLCDGIGTYIQRDEYLRTMYGIKPRCDLPKSSTRFAGWKSMIEVGFSDYDRENIADWTDRRWIPMEFLLDSLGRLFWSAHKVYQKQLASIRPPHPYYFVNLGKNRGEPMTRSNVDQVLAASCRRAGVAVVRPHRLRHMYGNCLADWGVSILESQILMRHASIRSTLVYYPIKDEIVRNKLAEIDAERRARDATDQVYPTLANAGSSLRTLENK